MGGGPVVIDEKNREMVISAMQISGDGSATSTTLITCMARF
jgi:hypothetical protein